MMIQKKNKYNARRQTYDGYNYDSRLEAEWAQNFDLMKNAGEILDWDRQFKVEITAYDAWQNPRMTISHKIDFRIHELNGKFVLVEIKGFETADYKMRRRWLEKLWLPNQPDYQYQVIKAGQSYRGFK